MEYPITLVGGKKQLQQTAGKYFLIQSLDADETIEIRFLHGTTELEHVKTAGKGFKARMSGNQSFTALEFKASGNVTINVIISDGLVDIDVFEGATVNAHIIDNPLPVITNKGQNAGAPMYVTGLMVESRSVAGITQIFATVDDSTIEIAPADASRVQLTIRNSSAYRVAIGPATMDFVEQVTYLEEDDVTTIDVGANLAWYACTELGAGHTVNLKMEALTI